MSKSEVLCSTSFVLGKLGKLPSFMRALAMLMFLYGVLPQI